MENLKLAAPLSGDVTTGTPAVTLGDPRYIRIHCVADGADLRYGPSPGYLLAAGADSGIMPYTEQTVRIAREGESGTVSYVIERWIP